MKSEIQYESLLRLGFEVTKMHCTWKEEHVCVGLFEREVVIQPL